MSATRREPSKRLPQTRTRRVLIKGRAWVNWSNKASPRQWQARKKSRP